MADDGFIRISNREIWDAVQGLRDTTNGMRTDLTNILTENVDLRKRVRSLELKFYGILSAAIALVGTMAMIYFRAPGGVA